MAGQDLPCRPIDTPADSTTLCRRDRRALSFQNRLVPGPNAFRSPPHVHGASTLATIVAEYTTQVQYDQLIFPQSFGGGAGVRQSGSFSESDYRFKCRPRRTSLSHLIFDLGSHFKFTDPRFQQLDGGLHDFPRQDGRPAHLHQFCRVLAHSETLDLVQSWVHCTLVPVALRRLCSWPTATCMRSKPTRLDL